MRSVRGYEILREIGRGSMGVVQLARQSDLDRLVALKELNRVHASTPELARRFVREARIAGSLSHPNIVTVFDTFEFEETPYIAMEYLSRGSLRPWMGHLTFAQLAGVLEGLLAGLTAAESKGVVHRDLKPENIMVAADGRVEIADFGIAKANESAGTASFLTATGATVGTPAYMAPEQALSKEVGPWTDLYSLGIMVYEQIVGRLPFADSKSSTEILMRHVSEAIPPVVRIRSDVDSRVSDWVARLLVKEPEHRTASAVQAWDELEEIVLDMLGPRWRRDALLSAPPGQATPAVSQPEVGRRPEVESRLLSFQRAPESTGVGELSMSQPDGSPEPSDPRLSEAGRRSGLSPSVERSRPSSNDAMSPRRRPRRGTLAGVLVGALAIPLGFVIAPAHGPTGAASAPMASVTTSAGEVLLPSGWRRETSGLPTPGLELDAPLALVSSSSSSSSSRRGKLVLGTGAAVDATLLPNTLLSLLPAAPHSEVVRLAGKDFYRYRDLRPRGSTVAETIYAQPTTAGTLVGACLLPRASQSRVEAECERILGSLTLHSATALALGPSAAYAGRLSRVVAELNRFRGGFGEALAGARTPAGQAGAARDLASLYERAATSLRGSDPATTPREVNAALTAALGRLAGGYQTIAHAADSRNDRRFDSGRAGVRAATSELSSALLQVKRLGYRVGS
jgi:serine/threonine protein kinase